MLLISPIRLTVIAITSHDIFVPSRQRLQIRMYYRRQASPLSLLVQTKILGRGNDAEGVGVAHSAPPALHADNGITLAEHTELDGVHDAPLKTAVDILLPWSLLEVGLLLGEVEGVYTAVQVGVLPIVS